MFLKESFEKVDFEKKSADNNKSMNILPSMQRVKGIYHLMDLIGIAPITQVTHVRNKNCNIQVG